MRLGYPITPLSFNTGLYNMRKSNGTDTKRKETSGITCLILTHQQQKQQQLFHVSSSVLQRKMSGQKNSFTIAKSNKQQQQKAVEKSLTKEAKDLYNENKRSPVTMKSLVGGGSIGEDKEDKTPVVSLQSIDLHAYERKRQKQR